MRLKVVLPVCLILATSLFASGSVLRGESAGPAANNERSPMRGQSARVLAVLDIRRERLKTLEAARVSAEADLREAIRQHPIDRALVRSLTAEIVNFSRQRVDDEEEMRTEVERILGVDQGASQ